MSRDLCVKCGKNPRRPKADTCTQCRKEYQLEYFRNRGYKRPLKPRVLTCKCGCGVETVYPVLYASEKCREKGKRESMDRNNARRREKSAQAAQPKAPTASKPRGDHAERFGLKPHRPDTPPPRKPLISEEEQQRLDAEASARDRAWHARFMKERMGLESPAPGLPLASKVTRPPKEVWKQYEEQYKPLRNAEKEFHIPLRVDIGYN